jgi:hypothetical protein
MAATHRPPERARRAVGWALVAALHLALGWALGQAMRPSSTPVHAGPAPAPVWLLPETPTPAREAMAPPLRSRPAVGSEAPRARGPALAPPTGGITLPATQAAPAEEPVPPEPAPSAADSGRLIDSAATQRAIREIARSVPLAERAAQASSEPPRESAGQRMGREIESSALGDCLKGEFPGAGGGLLSLPFLIAAELRGKCRR